MAYLADETPVPISQYDLEFRFLLEIFDELKPQKILEIGTHHGGTLYHWTKHAPIGATIMSIDNQHVNAKLYPDWAGYNCEIKWAKGDSTHGEMIDRAKEYGPYNFIFIDGDHSLKGVLCDWLNYGSLIDRNNTSLVAFHRILPNPPLAEVDMLWMEIRKEYSTLEIISNPGNGIGVVYFPGANRGIT